VGWGDKKKRKEMNVAEWEVTALKGCESVANNL